MSSMSTVRLYRSTLRDIRLQDSVHKYIQHRKTSSIFNTVRSMFEQARESAKPEALDTQQETRQLAELAAFLKANRLHQILLERYNAGVNMTQAERSRLTARRVGLNMPVEYEAGSSNPPQ